MLQDWKQEFDWSLDVWLVEQARDDTKFLGLGDVHSNLTLVFLLVIAGVILGHGVKAALVAVECVFHESACSGKPGRVR